MYPANITRDEANARASLLTTGGYQVTVDLTGSTAGFTSTSTATFTSGSGTTFVDLIADSIVEATLDDAALDSPVTTANGLRSTSPMAPTCWRSLRCADTATPVRAFTASSIRLTDGSTCTPNWRSRTPVGCTHASTSRT